MADRDALLATFLEVTGITDRAEGQRILEANDWDLDVSILGSAVIPADVCC